MNLKIHPSRRPSFRRSKCKTFHHLKNFAIINCISLRMQILTSSTLTFKKQRVYSEESGQKGFNILKRFQIYSRVLRQILHYLTARNLSIKMAQSLTEIRNHLL